LLSNGLATGSTIASRLENSLICSHASIERETLQSSWHRRSSTSLFSNSLCRNTSQRKAKLFRPRQAMGSSVKTHQRRLETSQVQKPRKAENPVRGSKPQRSGGASARLHLRNPIPPRRKLTHLTQNILLRLLTIHPPRIHRCLYQLLELPLKRQKLPLDIRTVNAVRVVRVLSTMVLIGRHGHPTALTAQSERH